MIFNLKKVVKKKNFGSLKNREGTIDNWGGGVPGYPGLAMEFPIISHSSTAILQPPPH